MDSVVARLEVVGLVLKVFDPLHWIYCNGSTVDPLDEVKNHFRSFEGVYYDGEDFVFADDIGCS